MKGNPKMNDLFPSGPEIVKIMRENPERHWLKLSKIHKNTKKRHGVAAINIDAS